METSSRVPVLEVGGSHVTAALVGLPEPGVREAFDVSDVARRELDPAWPKERIVGQLATAAGGVPVTGGEVWGVAMPGPFDYRNGLALFADGAVGKFASLHGLDMRRELMAALPHEPHEVVFVNDAEAFARGEYAVGGGRGFERVVFLTLGSGVGSAFIDGGRVIASGPCVPPDGHAYLITYRGKPLEESVSRRAIRREFARLTGADADVHEIAALARGGDRAAAGVLDEAMTMLGEAIGPWCVSFGADALVVGGAISDSWDLVRPPLARGLGHADPHLETMPVMRASSGTDSQFIGTALAVRESMAWEDSDGE